MLLFLISGDKSLKFEEFIPLYKELLEEKDTGTFADFMEAFKTFDREGQGFISGAELRHVLTSLGKCPPTTRARVLRLSKELNVIIVQQNIGALHT